MAADRVTLKDAIALIEVFDGENITLHRFIMGVDEARALVPNADEEVFVRLLKSKIIGEPKSISQEYFAQYRGLK